MSPIETARSILRPVSIWLGDDLLMRIPPIRARNPEPTPAYRDMVESAWRYPMAPPSMTMIPYIHPIP